MLYTSIKNEKIKKLKKLKNKKYRDEKQLFLVETKHLVKEAYESGFLKELLVKEGSPFYLDVETNYLSENVLKYLSDMPSLSDVIGVCHKKDGVLAGRKILILDDIQDPGNLGTIIRSSVAFGVHTIVLGNGCADIYSDKVIRSSQGMIFKANIIREDLIPILKQLKNDKYKIYGTRVTDGKNLKEIKNEDKIAIVMGNEGRGVSEEILKLCDDYIYINISKKCESLNVGVATSIILYEMW